MECWAYKLLKYYANQLPCFFHAQSWESWINCHGPGDDFEEVTHELETNAQHLHNSIFQSSGFHKIVIIRLHLIQ